MKLFPFSILALLAFMACSENMYPDRGTHIVDNTAMNEVLFWPPGQKYIAFGSRAVVEMRGLQRGYASARVLECGLRFTDSTATAAFFQAYSRVELPAEPSAALELEGLDTSLEQVFSRPVGTLLYLERPAGGRTDSALMVSAHVYAESLTYIPDTTGKVLKGRFLFRDSTSVHPIRTMQSDSLSKCETLQAAVYNRNGDTLKVLFHRLVLDSVSHATLSPCTGSHADSVPVVSNRFGFPFP